MSIADPYAVTPPPRPSRLHRWFNRHTLAAILGTFFLLFAVIVLWPYVVVVIPSGHAGVYYSVLWGGTDVNWVRREGFQLKFPFDTIFDYDIRLQQLVYRYSVISADGLTIQFKTSVRCRPRIESLGLLQRNIGPDYAEKIVIPETQTALRQVVGDAPLNQIYSTNVTILQKAVLKAVSEVSGKYIVIDDILITDIDIPEGIKKAVESKLSQQQNSLQYEYVLAVAKKEAERKRIEAEGIRDFQSIVTPGISQNFLRWKGIEATLDLSKSANAKVIVIGAQNGLPLILDTASALPTTNGVGTTGSGPNDSPFVEPPVPKNPSSSSQNPGLLVPEPVATPGTVPPSESYLYNAPKISVPASTPAPPVTRESPEPSPTTKPQPPVTRENPRS